MTAQNAGSKYKDKTIHLIGIGGSGMRALATMLVSFGAKVTGSDAVSSDASEKLQACGVGVFIGQRGENIPQNCDLVVHSAAISKQNPEYIEAQNRGIEIIKYAAMLGRLMDEKIGIAITGTHGKSTTSAMVSYVLSKAGVNPSYIVGANVEQLGGPSGVGEGEHFVAEACEYDRSFLHLHPHFAAILNVEEDHLDCFRDLDEIIEAFRAFGAGLNPAGTLVVNGEDRNALEAVRGLGCKIETFGLADECTWRGEIISPGKGKILLRVYHKNDPFCEVKVPLPGLHNAYNALAAIALLAHAGLSAEEICEHLEQFGGAHRRMSVKGQINGITVIDDFAHHPTEIQATLRALSNYYQPRRILCIFQPHQHSRTRFLLKDFAQSFAVADEVIVPDIYFVRDSEQEKDYISSKDLVAQIRLRGGVAIYLKSFEIINEYIKGVFEEGDLIVTMGAGNIWEVADELVRWLRENN